MKNIRPRHLFTSLLAFLLLASFTQPLKVVKVVAPETISTNIANQQIYDYSGLNFNPVQSIDAFSVASGNPVSEGNIVANFNSTASVLKNTVIDETRIRQGVDSINTIDSVSKNKVIDETRIGQGVNSINTIDSVSKNTVIDETRIGQGVNSIKPLPVKPLPISNKKALADKLLPFNNQNYIGREYYKFDSLAQTFKKTVNTEKNLGIDPVRFRLSSSKDSIATGEEIEITITAEYLDINPMLMFQLEGSNEFTLKMLLPEGFISSGGTYYDFIQGKVTKGNPKQEFTIKGFFESVAIENEFKLLRGSVNAGMNDYYYLATKLSLFQKPKKIDKPIAKPIAKSQIDETTLTEILKAAPPANLSIDPCIPYISFSLGPICEGEGFTVRVHNCVSNAYVVWTRDGSIFSIAGGNEITTNLFGTYRAACYVECNGNIVAAATQDAPISATVNSGRNIHVETKYLYCGQTTATLSVENCASDIKWVLNSNPTVILSTHWDFTAGAGYYTVSCYNRCSDFKTTSGNIILANSEVAAPTFSGSTSSCTGSVSITGNCEGEAFFTWDNNSAPSTSSGTYTGRCTFSGCSTSATVTVTVKNQANAPTFSGTTDVNNERRVCGTTTITGSCQIGQNFSWNNPSETGIITSSRTLSGSCSSANHCSTPGSISVTYYAASTPPTSWTGSQLLCNGAGVELDANCPSSTYPVWTSDSKPIPENMIVVQADTYHVTCQNVCGTSASRDVVITTDNSPNYPYIVGDGLRCNGGSATLQLSIDAEGGTHRACNGTLRWYRAEDSTPRASKGTGDSFTTSIDGSYYAECSTSCGSLASFAISVYSASSPSQVSVYAVDDKRILCGGAKTTLGYNGCNNSGNVTWTRDGVSISSVTDITQGGTYKAVCKNSCDQSENNYATITITNQGSCLIASISRNCNLVDLIASGCESGRTLEWSINPNFPSTVPTPYPVTGPTTFYARCTDSGGNVKNAQTQEINFITLPPKPLFSPADRTICKDGSIGFPASTTCNGNYTLVWAPSTISNTSSATYTASCTQGGCVSTETGSYPVYVNELATTGSSHDCNSITVAAYSLNATEAVLERAGQQDQVMPFNPDPAHREAVKFENLSEGQYYVYVKTAAGCKSAYSINNEHLIGTYAPTIVFDNGNDNTSTGAKIVCKNGTVTMKATNSCPLQYELVWQDGNNTKANSITVTYAEIASSTKTYTAKCTKPGCTYEATSNTLSVNIVAPVQPALNGAPIELLVCEGVSVNLVAIGWQCPSNSIIQWYNPSNVLVTESFKATYPPGNGTTTDNQIYKAKCKLNDIPDCYGPERSFTLKVNPIPKGLTASSTPTHIPPTNCNTGGVPIAETTVTLVSTSTSPEVTYVWKDPAGIVLLNASIPNASAAQSGTYTVTATLGICPTTATTSVIIYKACDLRFASKPVPTTCTNGAIGSSVPITVCGDIDTNLYLKYKLEKKDVNGIFKPHVGWTITGPGKGTRPTFTITGVLAGVYRVFLKTSSGNNESAAGCEDSNVYEEFEVICPCSAADNISYQRWNGIPGSTIVDLTSSINFQGGPTFISTLNSFDAPGGGGDDYGIRIRGYLCAPANGSYTFWVEGDDSAELWLSTDENPNNKVKIAWTYSSTNRYSYSEYATQKSAAITLQQNKKYYIEGLMKQGPGGDSFSVAWKKPSDPQPNVPPSTPIPAAGYLSPFTDCYIAIGTNISNPNNEIIAGQAVRLTANGGEATSTYAWKVDNIVVGTGITLVVNPIKTTTYTVTCTNCTNCVDGRVTIPVISDCVKMTAMHSGLSLYAEVSGTISSVKQGSSGVSEQVWKLARNADNTFKIRSFGYDKFIESNGSILSLAANGSANNQSWKFVATPIGTYSIQHPTNNPVLGFDVQNANMASGAQVFLWTANIQPYSPHQTFRVESVTCPHIPPNGCIAITPSSPQKVCAGTTVTLTASGGSDLNYDWYKVGVSEAVARNTVTYIVPGTSGADGQYYVIGSCNKKREESIKVAIKHIVISTPDASVYPFPATQGGLVTFKGNAIGTGTPKFKWTGPNGFSSTLQSPKIESANKATQEGVYTLTLTETVEGITCSNAATTELIINASNCQLLVNASPECNGNYGKITVTVQNVNAGQTVYYSLNRTTWQTSNVFNNLLAGNYIVYVRAGSGTQFCYAPEQEVEVQNCASIACNGNRKLSYDRWDGVEGGEIADFTEPEINNIFSRLPDLSAYAPDGVIFDVRNGTTLNFIARMQGSLCVPIAGNYRFSIVVDNSANLYIDGNLVLHAFNNETLPDGEGHNIPAVQETPIYLSAGPHSIKVVHKQGKSTSKIIVSWEIDGVTPRVVIEPEFLSTDLPLPTACRINLETTPAALPSTLMLGTNFQAKASSNTPSDTFTWTAAAADLLNSPSDATGVTSKTVANGIAIYIRPRTAGTKTYTVKNNATNCTKTITIDVNDVKCETCASDVADFQTQNPDLVRGFPTNKNYVVETTYLTEDESKGTQTISYFDGLGRPLQKINIHAGPLQEDIVVPIAYDDFGREVAKYLPYPVANNNGELVPNAIAGTNTWYRSKKNIDNSDITIDIAFAQTAFEESPLNRPTAQSNPGVQISQTNSIVSLLYGTNTFNSANNADINNIKKFSVTTGTATTTIDIGTYAAGKLFKTTTTDATNPNKVLTTIEYKDTEGRVICKQVDDLQTYYVYNELGQLVCVIQPEAVQYIPSSFVLFGNSDISELVFAYQYNAQGRLIRKKVPGATAVTMTYDTDKGLLLQTSDQVNDTAVQINYSYDPLNRPTITSVGSIEVMKRFYDKYNYIDSGMELPFDGSKFYTLSGTVPTKETNLKGMEVGSWVRLTEPDGSYANTSLKIPTTQYYDNRHQPIQTVSKNHLEKTDYVSTDLDFAGRANATFTEVNGATKLTTKIKNTFDYGSRAKSVSQQMNTDDWQPIATYSYSPLGEMIQKILGCRTQVVDYTYNIRGWMAGMNNPGSLKPRAEEYDFFGMTLRYTGDGNIIDQVYKAAQRKGVLYSEAYDIDLTDPNHPTFTNTYGYDVKKRLLTTNLTGGSKVFNMTISGYDKNGNIKHLTRTLGNDTVDDLTYNYTSKNNRLDNIADASADINSNYFSKTPDNKYTYYSDGSLKADDNKKITLIKYNAQKLVSQLTADGKTYTYTYRADGLKVKMTDGTNTYEYLGNTVYLNNKVEFAGTAEGRWLPKDKLKTYLVDKTISEGTAQYARYEYQLNDHLGNLRVACRCNEKANATAPEDAYQPVVVQENHYDPWGISIQGDVVADNTKLPMPDPADRYTYNGKETQGSFGWLDYGARMYDPTIGKWNSVDPLADKGRRWSPYNYAFDNPLIFIDPDGMWAIPPHLRYIFWGGAKRAGDNGAFYHAGLNVKKDYGNDGNIKFVEATSAAAIVSNLNKAEDNSIQSLDILTHGSQYALYMSKEGENVSLYVGSGSRFVQSLGQAGDDSRTIGDIDYSNFTKNAKIELHGCQTAGESYYTDNIASSMSTELYEAGKTSGVVIAHDTKANPNPPGQEKTNEGQDYRHGSRVVYHNGNVLFNTKNSRRIPASVINKYLKEKEKQGDKYDGSNQEWKK
jgi:RHS repeat-associated protein